MPSIAKACNNGDPKPARSCGKAPCKTPPSVKGAFTEGGGQEKGMGQRCFCCNCSRSAIMAMNSLLVGLPLAELTV